MKVPQMGDFWDGAGTSSSTLCVECDLTWGIDAVMVEAVAVGATDRDGGRGHPEGSQPSGLWGRCCRGRERGVRGVTWDGLAVGEAQHLAPRARNLHRARTLDRRLVVRARHPRRSDRRTLAVRSCARGARGPRRARMRGIPSARDGDGWPLVSPFLSMPLVGEKRFGAARRGGCWTGDEADRFPNPVVPPSGRSDVSPSVDLGHCSDRSGRRFLGSIALVRPRTRSAGPGRLVCRRSTRRLRAGENTNAIVRVLRTRRSQLAGEASPAPRRGGLLHSGVNAVAQVVYARDSLTPTPATAARLPLRWPAIHQPCSRSRRRCRAAGRILMRT
jgi:hypothetical protein